MKKKLLLGHNGERGFLFYKDKARNLKYSKFYLFRGLENEKTIIENCASFCGDTDKKGRAHIIALTDENVLVYIKVFENGIKKWTFSGNEKEIMPESLGILCLEEKCLVLLCLKKDDEFFYTSFFLSSKAEGHMFICKNKKYFPYLYFSAEGSAVSLILKCNGVISKYIFLPKEAVWKKESDIRLSKNETSREFVLKNNGIICGTFKEENTLFYFETEKNRFAPKKVIALTKRHMPNHGQPIIIFENKKVSVVWCGYKKIFKTEKLSTDAGWSKLKEYDSEFFGELFVRRKNGKTSYFFENQLLRQNMQSVKNIEETLVLLKKILFEHEKEIGILKDKIKNMP